MSEFNMFRVWDKKEKCYCEKAWVISGSTGDLCSLLVHMHLDKDDFVVERCTGYRYSNNNEPIYFGDLVKSASYSSVWIVAWNEKQKKIMLKSTTPMSQTLSSDERYIDFNHIIHVKVGTFFEGESK